MSKYLDTVLSYSFRKFLYYYVENKIEFINLKSNVLLEQYEARLKFKIDWENINVKVFVNERYSDYTIKFYYNLIKTKVTLRCKRGFLFEPHYFAIEKEIIIMNSPNHQNFFGHTQPIKIESSLDVNDKSLFIINIVTMLDNIEKSIQKLDPIFIRRLPNIFQDYMNYQKIILLLTAKKFDKECNLQILNKDVVTYITKLLK